MTIELFLFTFFLSDTFEILNWPYYSEINTATSIGKMGAVIVALPSTANFYRCWETLEAEER